MEITKEQNAKCHAIIHGASAAAAGVGAGLAQIPLSDNAVITPIQIGMIISLGAVLDIQLSNSAAVAILATVATGAMGRGVAQVLVGWIPGIGNTINATTAAAITEGVGWSTVKYFENLSEEEIKKYNSAKEQGRKEAQAEFDIKLKEINENFKKVCEILQEYEQLEVFLMSAFSIGIAAASIDGNVSNQQRKVLELAILGLGFNAIPVGIHNKVSQLFIEKPTFNDAMRIIEKVDKDHWHLFDKVVDIVLSIDDHNKEQKSAFRAAWNEKYNVA